MRGTGASTMYAQYEAPKEKEKEKEKEPPKPAYQGPVRPPPRPPPPAARWGAAPPAPFRPAPRASSDMTLPVQIGILALLAVFLFMSLRSG